MLQIDGASERGKRKADSFYCPPIAGRASANSSGPYAAHVVTTDRLSRTESESQVVQDCVNIISCLVLYTQTNGPIQLGRGLVHICMVVRAFMEQLKLSRWRSRLVRYANMLHHNKLIL